MTLRRALAEFVLILALYLLITVFFNFADHAQPLFSLRVFEEALVLALTMTALSWILYRSGKRTRQ